MEIVKQFAFQPYKLLDINYIGRVVFLETLKNVRRGQVTVTLPDKSVHTFGSIPANKPKSKNPNDPDTITAAVTILEDRFFGRLVASADLGFAEGFMDGEVTIDDLTALLKIFIFNRDYMNNLDVGSAFVGRLFARISHWRSANTVAKARDNVSAHYDLSNDMFAAFLDPTMTYSCPIFESENDTLEQAQLNKIHALLSKAHIREDDHILEIGTGWGALSIEAVKTYNCRVTSLTLSAEQKVLAEERIAAAGFSDRITVLLCDYRNLPVPFDPVTGQPRPFDAIVSCEMIEQVGHEFLPTFFACCERLLAEDGILVIQAITMPDYRYAGYLKGCDFIQKYIFPGGVCPSLTALLNAATEATQLVLDSTTNIGPHYGRTLRLWREKFMAPENVKHIAQLGFDDKFIRAWEYYFAYCEAGFATRTIGDHHLVFSRTCNTLKMSKNIPA